MLKSPSQKSFRLSNHGFQPLSGVRDDMDNRAGDIPLQAVVSHTPSPTSPRDEKERGGLFHGRSHRGGRRRMVRVDSQTGAPLPPPRDGEEKTALNRMGRIYNKILNYSLVTRYMVYVTPIALLLAIPIILSQTRVIRGSLSGSNQRYFWIWIEISKSVPPHCNCLVLTYCVSLA